MNNGQIVGDILLAGFIAKKVQAKKDTKKAAYEEGITYEEMRLRQDAAKYRQKAFENQSNPKKAQRWAAKATACDKQLARLEATRQQKTGEVAPTQNPASNHTEVQSGVSYCEHCGALRQEEARFCGGCGKAFNCNNE
ncbi:hypothetical protein ACHAWF_011726 [Thalassiosira exigua]